MATSWKSQQGDGKYALQFETDDKEKYKTVEKAAQRAIDGNTSDVVEVVRCRDCKYFIPSRFLDKLEYPNEIEADGLCDNKDKYTDNCDYCSHGGRKE